MCVVRRSNDNFEREKVCTNDMFYILYIYIYFLDAGLVMGLSRA